MTRSLPTPEDARKDYENLMSVIMVHRGSAILIGRGLHYMRDSETYKLATGIDTWHDFLKEIGISVSEANRSIDLFETFCLQYGYPVEELAEAKTKSLHYLLPVAKSGTIPENRIRELVEDAKHLNQNQFRENIFDAKGESQGLTPDKVLRTYQFVLMRKCNETGTLQRMQEITHETIIKAMGQYGIDLTQEYMPEVL